MSNIVDFDRYSSINQTILKFDNSVTGKRKHSEVSGKEDQIVKVLDKDKKKTKVDSSSPVIPPSGLGSGDGTSSSDNSIGGYLNFLSILAQLMAAENKASQELSMASKTLNDAQFTMGVNAAKASYSAAYTQGTAQITQGTTDMIVGGLTAGASVLGGLDKGLDDGENLQAKQNPGTADNLDSDGQNLTSIKPTTQTDPDLNTEDVEMQDLGPDGKLKSAAAKPQEETKSTDNDSRTETSDDQNTPDSVQSDEQRAQQQQAQANANEDAAKTEDQESQNIANMRDAVDGNQDDDPAPSSPVAKPKGPAWYTRAGNAIRNQPIARGLIRVGGGAFQGAGTFLGGQAAKNSGALNQSAAVQNRLAGYDNAASTVAGSVNQSTNGNVSNTDSNVGKILDAAQALRQMNAQIAQNYRG